MKLVKIKKGVLVNVNKVIAIEQLPREEIRVYFDIAETAVHRFWYSDLSVQELIDRLGVTFVQVNTGLWVNPIKVIGLVEQNERTRIYFDIKDGYGSGFWFSNSSLENTAQKLTGDTPTVDAESE